jgi:hypothetical protein
VAWLFQGQDEAVIRNRGEPQSSEMVIGNALDELNMVATLTMDVKQSKESRPKSSGLKLLDHVGLIEATSLAQMRRQDLVTFKVRALSTSLSFLPSFFLHLQFITPTTCITDDKLAQINAEVAFASSAE